MIRFGIISTLAAGVVLAGAGLTEASNVPVPPRVVTASSASGNAVFTIADMSPDTGVYAVQWVTQGDDIQFLSDDTCDFENDHRAVSLVYS